VRGLTAASWRNSFSTLGRCHTRVGQRAPHPRPMFSRSRRREGSKKTDDPSKRGQQDRSHINRDEDPEVRYRCKKFAVTPDKLRAVVDKYGNSAKTVENEVVG
jgi:Protein of unknown function (DUF3606)